MSINDVTLKQIEQMGQTIQSGAMSILSNLSVIAERKRQSDLAKEKLAQEMALAEYKAGLEKETIGVQLDKELKVQNNKFFQDIYLSGLKEKGENDRTLYKGQVDLEIANMKNSGNKNDKKVFIDEYQKEFKKYYDKLGSIGSTISADNIEPELVFGNSSSNAIFRLGNKKLSYAETLNTLSQITSVQEKHKKDIQESLPFNFDSGNLLGYSSYLNLYGDQSKWNSDEILNFTDSFNKGLIGLNKSQYQDPTAITELRSLSQSFLSQSLKSSEVQTKFGVNTDNVIVTKINGKEEYLLPRNETLQQMVNKLKKDDDVQEFLESREIPEEPSEALKQYVSLMKIKESAMKFGVGDEIVLGKVNPGQAGSLALTYQSIEDLNAIDNFKKSIEAQKNNVSIIKDSSYITNRKKLEPYQMPSFKK